VKLRNGIEKINASFERRYDDFLRSLSPVELIQLAIRQGETDKSYPRSVKALKQMTSAEMEEIEKHGYQGFTEQRRESILRSFAQEGLL